MQGCRLCVIQDVQEMSQNRRVRDATALARRHLDRGDCAALLLTACQKRRWCRAACLPRRPCLTDGCGGGPGQGGPERRHDYKVVVSREERLGAPAAAHVRGRTST